MRPGGARPWGTVGTGAWLPREWGLELRGAQRVDHRHLLLGAGKNLTHGVLLAPCLLGAGRRSPSWMLEPGTEEEAALQSLGTWEVLPSSHALPQTPGTGWSHPPRRGVPCLRRPVSVFCVYWR